MRNIIILLFLLSLCHSGESQKLNEDSIKKIIAESPVDSTRVNAMQTYANYLIRHKMQDSIGLELLYKSKKMLKKLRCTQELPNIT